ncbi:FTR1 family protein [Oceanicoccus sp. KOV_DT_Chl]|uniref:FTR1 family protein n=1 Tax=Oceanicoccus sp. KOV_DT_Chl TaxID=1904639 RepID=UPI000C7D1613|nr:FTR1 family protein [Oceanicoccus sp. KOV_DT_Chl]
MLISSVILVLREVLEAAILISVLLALSANSRFNFRWLWYATPFALCGSLLYATSLDTITDALDGAGQEVTNASLQLIVFLLILIIVAANPVKNIASRHWIKKLMSLAVACALIREGSEIYIYITGFSSAEALRTAVFTGSAIGASIGISLGILLFSILRIQTTIRCNQLCLLLLTFIGAGMVMQATILLEQADWIPASKALWDSSNLLDEQSVTGELLYAVFGYESTPSLIQVIIYCLSFISIISAWFYAATPKSTTNVL